VYRGTLKWFFDHAIFRGPMSKYMKVTKAYHTYVRRTRHNYKGEFLTPRQYTLS